MGCFMNILWLMFGGIITAVEYLIASLLMMFTIIGIPFGMQTLKMASLALWPFGKEVRSGERSNGCLYVLMNILWIFLGGIWICLSHLGFGLLLCITIIGIPFGNYVSFEETVNYIDHQFKKRRLCFRMVSWNILSTLYMTILKWLVAFWTKAHFPFHVHHYPMNIYN